VPSEIAWPFAIDKNGAIARVSDDVSIARKYIVSAVGTHLTERVMRPLYGSETMYYVFDPSDDSMTGLLEAEIRRAVAELVPEVSLTEVTPLGGSVDGVLLTQIAFVLNRTGEQADVVATVHTAVRTDGVVVEETV